MSSYPKIGLLGGSFNPAHPGHLHISEIARKQLDLLQVWWLVSPQNPLKSTQHMMSFGERFASAKKIVGRNGKIKILDIEQKFDTRYTVDTLKRLRQKYPQYKFYWLMGADNLLQLPRWRKWQEILQLAEMHVFDRDKYFYKAINSLAFQKFNNRIKFHLIKRNPNSSTQLRKALTLKVPN